jgi:hypothetical protein
MSESIWDWSYWSRITSIGREKFVMSIWSSSRSVKSKVYSSFVSIDVVLILLVFSGLPCAVLIVGIVYELYKIMEWPPKCEVPSAWGIYHEQELSRLCDLSQRVLHIIMIQLLEHWILES